MTFQRKNRSRAEPAPRGKRHKPLSFTILQMARKYKRSAVSIRGQRRGFVSRVNASLGFISLPPRARIEKVAISSRRAHKP